MPTFFSATVMAEEVPSCSVPKSMLDGRRTKPLTMTLESARETVRYFLLTGSCSDRNWDRAHAQTDTDTEPDGTSRIHSLYNWIQLT